MKSINRVQLLGYLGHDLALMHSQKGTSYTHLSIATTKAYKGQNGWEETTEWNNVSLYGSAAEFFCKYAGKGTKVYFEGRVETKQDAQGQYKTYIGGSVGLILHNARQQTQNQNPPQTTHNNQTQTQNNQADFWDDDIPF